MHLEQAISSISSWPRTAAAVSMIVGAAGAAQNSVSFLLASLRKPCPPPWDGAFVISGVQKVAHRPPPFGFKAGLRQNEGVQLVNVVQDNAAEFAVRRAFSKLA